MSGASRFAGGDQGYLREEQYRDASRLSIRADLHVRYGTAEVPWFEWVRARLDLQEGHRADVVAYSCSSPPGEDATPEQRAQLEAAVARSFEDGNGVMVITKDVGCFVCRHPR